MVVLGWRRLHEAAWPREVTEFTIVLARDLDRAAPRFGFQPLEMLRARPPASLRSAPVLSPARHPKIREISAGGLADPEAEGAARAATQLVDDERGLGPVVHEHADLRPLDDDANVKP